MVRTAFVLLALAVVLAGCPGAPTTGSPTATDTPSSTATATPTATPTPSSPIGDLAPGVTADGIADVAALLSAHESTLLADGATLALAVTRTEPGGTVSQRSNQTLSLGPGARPVTVNGTGLGPDGPLRVDAWLTDDSSLYRFRDGNSTDYRVLDPLSDTTRLVWAGNVDTYLRAAAGNFTMASTGIEDGTRVTTLRAGLALVNGSADPDTEMTMTVTGDGVIRSFDLTQTQPDGDEYGIRYRVLEVGVTPAEPAWVASVPAGAFLDVDLDVAVTDDALVTVTNDGPDAVPANATVTVAAGGTSYDATLTDPLEPGETRWLWVDDGTGTLTVADDRPASPSARALGGQATVVVRTADGTTLVTADLAWRTNRTR